MPGPLEALAFVGFGMAAADVIGHVWNARKIRRLHQRVDDSIARAEGDRDAMKADLSAVRERLAPASMSGGHDPRDLVDTRESKRDARARASLEILAAATERLGDTYGPAVVEWVKAHEPDAWKRALDRPQVAMKILGPVLDMGAKMLQAQNKERPKKDVPTW